MNSSLLGLLVIAALAGTVAGWQCKCGATMYFSNGGTKFFYTYPYTSYDKCTAQSVNNCKANCLNYVNNYYSHQFNPQGYFNGQKLGDWFCQRVNSYVPPNSYVMFVSQSCGRNWENVNSVPGIGCKNGKYVYY